MQIYVNLCRQELILGLIRSIKREGASEHCYRAEFLLSGKICKLGCCDGSIGYALNYELQMQSMVCESPPNKDTFESS